MRSELPSALLPCLVETGSAGRSGNVCPGTGASEITAEFVIRSTFCDLAITTNGQLRFLIEVKAIGTDLKENHLRQAADYGANQGADWVLLTNGADWRAYRIRFEQPVSHDLVFELNLPDGECKTSDLVRMLYLISREAVGGEEIDRYWRQKEATNRFVIGQLLLSPPLLSSLRRELRRLAPGIRVTEETLGELLRLEVLKRDVLEGDKAETAAKRMRRATRKRERERAAESEHEKVTPVVVTPVSSGSIAARPVGVQ